MQLVVFIVLVFTTSYSAGVLWNKVASSSNLVHPWARFARRDSYSSDSQMCYRGLWSRMEICASGITRFSDVDELKSMKTPDQLDEVCGVLENATACIENAANTCENLPMDFQVTMDTMRNSVNFFCSASSKTILLEETDCWEEPQLEVELIGCYQELDAGMNSGNFCPSIENGLDCFSSKTLSVCGSQQASTFIYNFLYQALEPAANRMLGCDLENNNLARRDLMNLLKNIR